MNIYEKNLRYLKRNSQQIYDIITKQKDLYKVKITDIEEDNCMLEREGVKCYLHSTYDKIWECEKMLSTVDEKTDVLIIFGVGYGYLFKYLKDESLKIEHIILIEPNIQLFKRFLKANKIESLLKFIPKISFIINHEAKATAVAIEEIIGGGISTNMQFVYNITYRTVFNDYYNKMSEHIVEILGAIRSNVATHYSNTYKLLVNVMKNLKIQGYGVKRLSEFLKNVPVIIVSAGPSLNKNLDILEEAKNKAIVIAVGTAIEILEQNNVKPHFRAAFSPHVDTTIFKKLNNYDIPLIYTNNLYFDILPEYSGPKFRIISDSDMFSRYVYHKAEVENTFVISELSIANVIFEYLCNLGCKDIILVGQDLAYKENSMYAKGAINNINITEDAYGIIKEKDVEGKEVFTDLKFKRMRDALVRSIKRYGIENKNITNTSEGGLCIPNTAYMKLQDKLKDMRELNNLDTEIQKIISQEEVDSKNNLREIVEVVYEIKKEVSKMKAIAEERVVMLKKVVKMKDEGVKANEILKEYEKINKLEQKMLSIPFYNEVTKYQLHGNYSTVISAFKYAGKDQNKQVQALESILIRVGVELMSYFEIFEALLKEYGDYFKEYNLLSEKELLSLQMEQSVEEKEKKEEIILGLQIVDKDI